MVKASCTTVVKFITKAPVRLTYPAGIFDMNTAYVGTDRKAPYVYYEAGKTYYVLNKETTVKGINPATDYAANGKQASWIPFENFKAIFVEIFMALFARLGSAVFWGDYMFSQHGVDANGNATADYQNFDGLATKAFTPNFYVNFRTGKVYARDVEITGIVNAIGGLFRGRIETSVNGRRIVLDPDTGTMSMFDSKDNEVISIGYIENELLDSASATLKIKDKSWSGYRNCYLTLTGNTVNIHHDNGFITLYPNIIRINFYNEIMEFGIGGVGNIGQLYCSNWPTSASQVNKGFVYSDGGILKVKQ